VNVSRVKCGLALVSEVTNDLPNLHIVNVETYKLYKEFVLVEVTWRVDLFSCWSIKRFQRLQSFCLFCAAAPTKHARTGTVVHMLGDFSIYSRA
jgi:hypothetical protein